MQIPEYVVPATPLARVADVPNEFAIVNVKWNAYEQNSLARVRKIVFGGVPKWRVKLQHDLKISILFVCCLFDETNGVQRRADLVEHTKTESTDRQLHDDDDDDDDDEFRNTTERLLKTQLVWLAAAVVRICVHRI